MLLLKQAKTKLHIADLKHLDQKMRDRLEWSDIKLLRSILTFLDTQNWQCHETETGEDDGSEDDSSLVEIKASLSINTRISSNTIRG